jgi:hypothetical protein
MGKQLLVVLSMFVAVFLAVGSAEGAVVVTGHDTDTVGTNEVTWISSFEDLDYTLGAPITLTVVWSSTGLVEFDNVGLRGYTPKSKNGAAQGTDPVFVYPGSAGANSVDITLTFLALHPAPDGLSLKGNGHFTVYLRVDEDGDGATDSTAGFGVNVHVEDPL